MEILQGVLKQHLRPHAVVGYGVKIFLPSPPNYVTRSPGDCRDTIFLRDRNPYKELQFLKVKPTLFISCPPDFCNPQT